MFGKGLDTFGKFCIGLREMVMIVLDRFKIVLYMC